MNASLIEPYSGLRVLDLSQGIAGPYCAMILLENGAQVVKVEPPTGDWSRGIGQAVDGMSALSIAYNQGKRSICIDASRDEGRELIRRLALQSDVVIESFRPGVMERLGLSYAELSRERPDLVYVSVTAFGREGPYSGRPGSDSTLQAMSGLMQANRDACQVPRKVGILLVDIATGIYAAQATGAALYRLKAHGVGQHLDLSLLDTAAALQSGAIVDEALSEGRVAQPHSVPAGTFATRDGHINVTSLHDRMFIGLCQAIKQGQWAADPRFATAALRFQHAEEINAALQRIFGQESTAYWVQTLNQHGVVCGKVSGYADFLEDPQVRYRGLFQPGRQGDVSVPMARLPGTAPAQAAKPSPRRGEHTRDILAGLGLGRPQQQKLHDAGIVSSWNAGQA